MASYVLKTQFLQNTWQLTSKLRMLWRHELNFFKNSDTFNDTKVLTFLGITYNSYIQ